jgi:decaprenylphospho-beta-D-erythro-pentofuranosid-2-ulose 2-reductase
VRNVVIFGATSAIAEATARLWASRKYSMFLIGRNEHKLGAVRDDLRARAAGPDQRIEIRAADLTDFSQHKALIEAADRALGGIDIALIAHGSLPEQAECEKSVQQMLAEITTNGLSVVSLLTLLANYFEQRGRGTIVAISSVAGDRGRQSNYVYGSAKGMVSLFMQGLRNRLAPKGISVVTIKPGFVDTPMTAAFTKSGPLWSTPARVAQGIVKAVDKRRDVAYVPGFWRLIMLVICHIPERLFKRLKL